MHMAASLLHPLLQPLSGHSTSTCCLVLLHAPQKLWDLSRAVLSAMLINKTIFSCSFRHLKRASQLVIKCRDIAQHSNDVLNVCTTVSLTISQLYHAIRAHQQRPGYGTKPSPRFSCDCRHCDRANCRDLPHFSHESQDADHCQQLTDSTACGRSAQLRGPTAEPPPQQWSEAATAAAAARDNCHASGGADSCRNQGFRGYGL